MWVPKEFFRSKFCALVGTFHYLPSKTRPPPRSPPAFSPISNRPAARFFSPARFIRIKQNIRSYVRTLTLFFTFFIFAVNEKRYQAKENSSADSVFTTFNPL
jgi:hypothetical protein